MKSQTFTCDLKKCKSKVEISECGESYPYIKGWVYLFRTELKTAKNEKIIFRDKHYCCYEHLLEDIKGGLELSISKKNIIPKISVRKGAKK